jgi:hypothetical protein
MRSRYEARKGLLRGASGQSRESPTAVEYNRQGRAEADDGVYVFESEPSGHLR